MKSITVTTHRSYNYGGILQAYALQKFIKSLGIENDLLQLPITRHLYKKIDYSSFKRFLLSIYSNLNAFFHQKDGHELRQKFDDFILNELTTTELFDTKEKLYDSPPVADFYLCGSDQVFSVRNKQTYARMLEWVPNDKKKYSYAASLGEYDWTDNEKLLFSNMIESFSGISVRERYAKNVIDNLTNKIVRVDLDPVFLLKPQQYDFNLENSSIKEPYILVYPLISNKHMQSLIDKSKQLLGIKTVSVRVSRNIKYNCDSYIYDAGPKEFIGLLRNASAILTTSFHGVALACLFNIPFYVAIKDFKSQRITDLLERFGLSDRIYNDDIQLSFDVNFDLANTEIENGRLEAQAYFEQISQEVRNGNQ